MTRNPCCYIEHGTGFTLYPFSTDVKTYLTNSLIDFIELENDGRYEADEQRPERQRDCYSAQCHEAETP